MTPRGDPSPSPRGVLLPAEPVMAPLRRRAPHRTRPEGPPQPKRHSARARAEAQRLAPTVVPAEAIEPEPRLVWADDPLPPDLAVDVEPVVIEPEVPRPVVVGHVVLEPVVVEPEEVPRPVVVEPVAVEPTVVEREVPRPVVVGPVVVEPEVPRPDLAVVVEAEPPEVPKVPDAGTGDAAAERRHPWRAVAQTSAWATAVVAVVVVLLVFVFPTKTYLNQRRQLATTVHELRLLDQQNGDLSAQVARLQTDTEIERLAREQYDLVRPGERAFAILPPPTPPTTAPPPVRATPPPSGLLHRLTAWIP